jgi:undecaprenyl-diphosphatase
MLFYQAIILAVIQAFTEFLPISSTAHLVLFPWLFHWPDGGLAFDVALHMGTLVAVLLYLLPTWIELVLCGVGVHYPRGATPEAVYHNRQTFWYLVVATVPAAVFGLLFEKTIEEHLRQPIPIAVALIVIGLLMWWTEARASLQHEINQTSFLDAIIIGSAQALALFPGVSRSGITIAAGLQRGMKREAAARFSFLLATPVIAGAALKELPKLAKMHQMGTLEVSLSTLLICIAVSGVLGMIVIRFFLRYLQTRTLKIFIYYRILFGIVILLLAFLQMGSAR